MAVLITGGLGVIGSHLAEHLGNLGFEVVVADRMILKREGYVRADVTRHEELAPVFSKWPIEHVFHFAGEVGRENGEEFPRRCIEINESGTFNLAQLCLEHKARLYFASSSEIYGDLGDVKLTEDLADRVVLRPTNVYGLSKLHAENYLRHFASCHGIIATAFRFFMVYGEGEHPSPYRSAMANFVWNLLHDRPISVHQGTYRSWCHVQDIVNACRLAIETPQNQPYEAYNLGRDGLRSTKEIARLVCELTGKPENLIRLEEPPTRFATRSKDASFDKARERLGYEAEIPVEDGIRRTIQWQRGLMAQEHARMGGKT